MGKGRIFSEDELPEYCQSVIVEDHHGRVKQLILPKALDLDRPKRARTWFNASQLEVLEREYQANPYVTGDGRRALAERLGLSETQVKVWFQNRRTKSKKEKTLASGCQPPSANSFLNFTSPKKLETRAICSAQPTEPIHWPSPPLSAFRPDVLVSSWLTGLQFYNANRAVSQQEAADNGNVDWSDFGRKLSAGCFSGGEVKQALDMVREDVGGVGDKPKTGCFSEPEGSFEVDEEDEIEVI